MFKFYIRYISILVAYLVTAIKIPIFIRTLQNGTDWFIDSVENLFEIPPQYMVMADMANIDDLLNLAFFGIIMVTLYRMSLLLLQHGWDWVISLIPKRQSAK